MRNTDFSSKFPTKFFTPSVKKPFSSSQNAEQTKIKPLENQDKSYFLKPQFSNNGKMLIPGATAKKNKKPFELFPNYSLNNTVRKSIPRINQNEMSDINEKKSQKDQIIMNKSEIHQHLKTQFNETTTPSPKQKLQCILTCNDEKNCHRFTFNETEILEQSIGGYLKTNTLFSTSSNRNSVLTETKASCSETSAKLPFFGEKKSLNNSMNLSDLSLLRTNLKTSSIMSFIYSTRTRKGLLSNSPKEHNQDNFIAIPNFTLESSSHLFSVCDGHGENGHLVSYFIKENFPKILKKRVKSPGQLSKQLYDSVSELEHALARSPINVDFSGSTMIVVFIHGNTIYISNVGDSRAILGRENSLNQVRTWDAIALSEDHKPDIMKEKERIEGKGGVVVVRKHSEKSNNACRAWIPCKRAFGLSMSRSLGDLVAKNYGIIWEPEIKRFEIGEMDKFMVIGSDGVWEIINNDDCVQLVSKYYQNNELEKASDALMAEVMRRWDNVFANFLLVLNSTLINRSLA